MDGVVKDLNEFLIKTRVSQGETNNITCVEPKGRYYISTEVSDDGTSDYERFMKMYMKIYKQFLVDKDNEELKETQSYLHFCELPKDNPAPLRFDIDFKSKKKFDGDSHVYNFKNHIKPFIEYIQEMIRITVAEWNDSYGICVILEKPHMRWDDKLECSKDGIHLHFPFFVTTKWVAESWIYPAVIKKITETGIWNDLELITTIENAVDKIHKKPWYMVGSAKSSTSLPYLPTRFMNSSGKVKRNVCSIFNECKEWQIPLHLSILNRSGMTKLSESVITQQKMEDARQQTRVFRPLRDRDEEAVKKDLDIIRDYKLLDMIKDEHADNRDSWMDIGWTLFNIGMGCQDALDLWIEFSQKSVKFEDGTCEKEWDNMRLGKKTLNSLYKYCKEGDPDGFRKFQTIQIDAVIDASLIDAPNETDAAKVMKIMYDYYVCSDPKNNIWYYFNGVRWVLLNDALEIRQKACDLVDVYRKTYMELHEKTKTYQLDLATAKMRAKEEKSEEAKQEVEAVKSIYAPIMAKMDKCMIYINKLKTSTFQEKLIKQFRLLCYMKDFEKIRDEKRELMAFDNGILDLDALEFREGKREDYITMSTNYNYQQFSWNENIVQEFMDFLRKIFPSKKRLDFFLRFFALCLYGGNIMKSFLIMTGVGHNGKSVISKLIDCVFGDYAGKFPREMFIGASRNNSGAANPELARTKGKRLMSTQEITDKEEFNLGQVKNLTGGDDQYIRGLYKEGQEITTQFTTYLQCNRPPKVKGALDQAFWNRVKVLFFESVFDTEAPKDIKKQWEKKHFLPDLSLLNGGVKKYAPVFMWILFEEYKKYVKEGKQFIFPDEIMEVSRSYQRQNDLYKKFFDSYLEKSAESEIKTTILYNDFKLQWSDDGLPRRDLPSKIEVLQELQRVLKIESDIGATLKGYKKRPKMESKSEEFEETETKHVPKTVLELFKSKCVVYDD